MVIASAGGKQGQQSITVVAVPVASVTVSPASLSLVVGGTQQLTPTTLDVNGATLTGRTISWTTSDATKATVSAAGLVTAAAVGTATITATSEGKSGAAALTVTAAPPTIASFSPTHAAYGFQVTVTGTGFTAASAVAINGIAAAVVVFTATTLTVAIPSNATSGPIVVTTAGASATSSAPFTVDAYGPAIVINSGGTYSGNWQSLDPSVAAVTVRTGAAVVIENCRISSTGDGVDAYNGKANLTVRHCTGDVLNPNVAGMAMGMFVVGSNVSTLVVEHNLITGYRYGGDAVNNPPADAETYSGQKVSFRYNVMHNQEGRSSDGRGGFIAGNGAEKTSNVTAAFVVYLVRNAAIEIAWNELVNQPYQSQTEDVISIAESRGLSGTPMDIHDNYIQGVNPANAATYTTFGGCGIQVGDSPSKSDVGYVHVHDNQIVNFASCGISISSGHDIEFDHNRVISARTLPDGTIMNNQWRVPLQMVDNYWDLLYQNIVVADPYWHDNSMHDNLFSAVRLDGSLASPTFFQMGTTVTQSNNADALGHLATTADEQAEYVRWKQKLVANGIVIGP
jgi:hypothetical protein